METEINTDQIAGWADKIIELAITYGPKLLLAIILLVIGLKVIRKLTGIARKTMEVANLNESLIPFFSSVVGIGLQVMLFLAVAGMVGIDTASFVAILAAASFAVGLALQGSLSNFAAGIIILIFRPYRAGQWIEVCDKFGQVEEIQIFNTIMVTPGQKTLIIPNGQVVENIVTNFSEKGHVRLELNVSMPYGADFPAVKKILMEVLTSHPDVLEEPEPAIGIETFDSHNIILTVRPFVEPDNFWKVTFEVHAQIKTAFHRNGVQVAYSEGVELGEIGA